MDAPNPGLQIDGLGIVSLPLSVREAEVMKSYCTRDLFGMGERTLVDNAVRGTWEMDAFKVSYRLRCHCTPLSVSQVSLSGPSWDAFLSRVVKEICHKLGINFEASRPRCELHKLLLYETGSQYVSSLSLALHDLTQRTVHRRTSSEYLQALSSSHANAIP